MSVQYNCVFRKVGLVTELCVLAAANSYVNELERAKHQGVMVESDIMIQTWSFVVDPHLHEVLAPSDEVTVRVRAVAPRGWTGEWSLPAWCSVSE